MKYNVVFIDLDDTLFDFGGSAAPSLAALFREEGLPSVPEAVAAFWEIDNRLWGRFERGEISKLEVFHGRWQQTLAKFGMTADAPDLDRRYRAGILEHQRMIPHAEELLECLHGRCELYAVTNGEANFQKQRMEKSGLGPYFDGIFISEEMDCKKPEAVFFDRVFQIIGPEKRPRTIIFGDSLTSDMQGGRNAGIATCLFGPRQKADQRCDFSVDQLLDFPAILGL